MRFSVRGAIIAIIAVAVTASADFSGYNLLVPIQRLISNTTNYIKENPTDPMGPYTLARIHYLALATRAFEVNATFGVRGLPEVYDRFTGDESRPRPSEENEDQRRNHLTQALENYRKALQMDDKNAFFHLGLASVSRAALDAGIKLGAIPGATASEAPRDGDFTPLWREQAIAEYLRAYELSIASQAAISTPPGSWGYEVLVSYVSGRRYVEMVTERGAREAERETLARVRASLEKLPRRVGEYITPIVFRLNGPAPLKDLLDTKRTVAFDLDGTGRSQRYTWLRPDTGILVWDPRSEGKITSGHQLFGSVSFRMFWRDGYRALDALDDNRDGELRGTELDGLAVWFDRNQDAVSDPGEVIPIGETGIAAISARATASAGLSPANETGLVMADGRVLPTYDWTTEPLNDDVPTPNGVPRS